MTQAADNLIENPRSAVGVHILVIGVSAYRHLVGGAQPTQRGDRSRLEQLTSAARSAALFAQWMLEHHNRPDKPLASLRVLLSPAADEIIPDSIADLMDGDHRATKANTEAALMAFINDCRADPANIAVVYIAGHGVQVTKDGATVLLEDYASDALLNELDAAIDVVGIHDGLNSVGGPDEQFWFVDACRQKPTVARRFEDLQGGISIDTPPGAVSASPLFLATTTGAPAFAQPGKETLFCSALLSLLNDWTAARKPGPLANGWHVSTTSLSVELPLAVEQVAATFGTEQDVDVAGKPNEALFHLYREPADVAIEIELQPATAIPCSRSLRDQRFAPVALPDDDWPLRATLPAGLYSIEVEPEAPFQKSGKLFEIRPRQYKDTIEVAP